MLTDASNPDEGDARKLIVAMALLTREFERSRVVAMLLNHERANAAVPNWAMLGAAALSGGHRGPAAPGPSQEAKGASGQPLNVVIVGQSKTLAVHDVGQTRFGREERREQDKQFREALFGGPTKIKSAGETDGPNARRAKEGADSAGVGMLAKSLAKQFAVVVGPLIALSTVLSQANSGFGVFQKSLQVLAATLAPILLPVFVLLAAAVLTVSDSIWRELLPKLGQWYKWILDVGIPVLEKFTKAIGNAAGALIRWAERLGGTAKDNAKEMQTEKGRRQFGKDLDPFGVGYGDFIGRNLPAPGDVHDFFNGIGEGLGLPSWMLRPRYKNASGEISQEQFGGKPEGPFIPPNLRGIIGPPETKSAGGPVGGFAGIADDIGNVIAQRSKDLKSEKAASGGGIPGMSDFEGNMDLVLKSLQMSMLPKPSYQSLTEVGRSANLAAVGQDPIDMMLLQRTILSFEKLLEAIKQNTEKKPEPTFKGGR